MSGVIWFTGLSGSGKTTTALALQQSLTAKYTTQLLDGDIIRDLFPSTGFDRQSRIEHIKRVGYLASLLSSHNILTICSFISPFEESRDFVRDLAHGWFCEIYLSTPLDECIRRDTKGLYKKALSGEIGDFTGISSPYEEPKSPELKINNTNRSISDILLIIMEYLEKEYGI